ncbi:MAG: hypothetical protein AVDCRST_MAG02-2482 [uncultured Rubrobacteraceae bacterium]|uniref:Uncharacterized protein n=1 Tax=uncultured Rubrobacteraceae bacterium TaxID=349277 RepID=A0A6J4R278_9ACTN|nr:MAG: hypothetical protein AVDCRST_MAG02-2482 [uncultured Rubrobacteraceae bacterium]
MSNWCTVRNIDAAAASVSWGSTGEEFRPWDGDAFGLLQRWTKVFRRELVRFLLLLLCWAARPYRLDRRGRMLWWSYGAFGNKGRLEGAQYLAGRRAPPSLR